MIFIRSEGKMVLAQFLGLVIVPTNRFLSPESLHLFRIGRHTFHSVLVTKSIVLGVRCSGRAFG